MFRLIPGITGLSKQGYGTLMGARSLASLPAQSFFCLETLLLLRLRCSRTAGVWQAVMMDNSSLYVLIKKEDDRLKNSR